MFRPLVNLGEKIMGVRGLRGESGGFFVEHHRLLRLARLREEQSLHKVQVPVVGLALQDRLHPFTHSLDVRRFLQRMGMHSPGIGEFSANQVGDVQGEIGTRIFFTGCFECTDPSPGFIPQPVPVARKEGRFDLVDRLIHDMARRRSARQRILYIRRSRLHARAEERVSFGDLLFHKPGNGAIGPVPLYPGP